MLVNPMIHRVGSGPPARSGPLWAVLLALALVVLPASTSHAVRWPWESPDDWPTTSERDVVPLDHPLVEDWYAEHDPSAPYRVAVFGDQRALADGEWQQIIRGIVEQDAIAPIAFVVDTGDMVSNGLYTDQWHYLREILAPLRHKPYVVGVGNHEFKNNKYPEARENAATFFSYLDPSISPDRFYYRKDLGAATFLFLDTNDFVYGEYGDRKACPLQVDPDTREGRQLSWLRAQAEELAKNPPPVTIAVMHHPMAQSSQMHLTTACSIWNFQDNGETLLDILGNAGVDVILTGHTHTYERFRFERDDGHVIHLLNLSGRPRRSMLWWGKRERRARDIRGREASFFDDVGFVGLDHWGVQQDALMDGKEADQFAILTIEPDGGVMLDVHFLDDDAPSGFRQESIRLR